MHECGHTAVAATVAKTRRRFWILKAHDLAKTINVNINVYPGEDFKVRSVRVKTGTGEYDRSVTKIAVVHPADGYE